MAHMAFWKPRREGGYPLKGFLGACTHHTPVCTCVYVFMYMHILHVICNYLHVCACTHLYIGQYVSICKGSREARTAGKV